MKTDPRHERLRRVATLALAASAAACVELALVNSAIAFALIRWCGIVGGMLILDAVIVRVARRRPTEQRCAQIAGGLLVVAAAAPWVWQLIWSLITGRGFEPIEMTTLATARNLVVVFAVTGRLLRQDHLLGIMSACAVVGAVAIGAHPTVGIAMVVYCLAMCWWLVIRYWSLLPRSSRGRGLSTPWMTLVVLAIVVGAIVGLRGVSTPGSGVRPVAEVVPSSGGERDASDDALSGVGTGPDAAGASIDAAASGHTEAEVFAKSHLPSLIDLLSEQYGDPVPPEVIERAVGLRPDQDLIVDREVDETASPNSRFSLLRRKIDIADRTKHDASDALLFVKGTAPQHLRLVTYDRFDGIQWHKAPEVNSVPSTVTFYDQPGRWMVLPAPFSLDIYAPKQSTHEIQFGRIETETLPMPNHTVSFHITHIGDPKFFRCESDGRVRMTRSMPDGYVVKVMARVCNTDRLMGVRWPNRSDDAPGFPIGSRTAAIAREWGAQGSFGWDQIQEVVRRIRAHGSIARGAALDEPLADPTERFLSEGGSAPDYLFASAAASILHALGYETRLVSGLYVNPDRYDWFRDHTPVYANDTHTWCEVRLADGVWITLEPTPGYSIASAGDGSFQRLAGLVRSVIAWLGRNWPVCVVVILIGVLLWLWRWAIVDGLATCIWRLRTGSAPHDRLVLTTIELIELRSRLARNPRRPSQTWSAWAGELASIEGVSSSIEVLSREANRCAFSSEGRVASDDSVSQLCARVARECTRIRIKQRNKGNLSE